MKLSQQSLSIIESAIQKAVGKYVCNCEQTVVTDIHLQPDQTSGQLNIYNDDDEELANVMVEECETYEGDDFIELESMLVEEHTAAFAAAALHGLGKVARQGGVLVHVPCRRNHGDADTLSIRHDEMTERHNH